MQVRPRLGRIVGTALVAVAPATMASPVFALEDGGTRSPFAAGAGSRSLALGGAFVAIGEDAEALAWNPAGLARATRTGFEATRDELAIAGASTGQAALVVPSWRWGALGLGVHHIGVSGIERRDDRNVVVGSDVSGGETEIALGYARPLGGAWSLGAALKLQSQGLAGYSASALAADAGLLVAIGPLLGERAPWLSGVRCGLAIRNLLEPALRLDRESVSDPRVWRAGVSWRGDLPGSHPLQVAVDVDRSDGVASRLHAGAELLIHPLLALRGGFDHGRATTGAGVRWRDLEVSYAYADGASEPTHRVGVSHAFGPSVSQRREAARQANEQVLQGRLDDEFQRRRAQQLSGLLQRANESLAGSDFNAALELLGAAATLDSTDARVRLLEAQCQNALGRSLEAKGDLSAAVLAFRGAIAVVPGDTAAVAGERRCRDRLDHLALRDAGRRRTFTAALDAFASGDLSAARSGFAALAGADSSDGESRAMLRRTQEAITHQSDELLRQARHSLETQEPDLAERLLGRARALDPRAPGLEELAAAITRSRGPSTGPDARATRPAAATDRRQAEEMFRRGAAAMSAHRPDEALHYWELAMSLDPSHAGAAAALNREYLVRGMDAYAAGRLDQAVGYWEKARDASPRDPRAAGLLERARERQERSRAILGGNR